MKFTVHPAEIADAHTLAILHGACFARGWPAQSIALMIADPRGIALTARAADGALAGLVLARVAADEAEILTLAVSPSHRRGGAASLLMAHAMAALCARGAAELFLEVSEAQGAALALYRQLGFTAAGRRPRYCDDGSDALLMRCDLASAPGVDGP